MESLSLSFTAERVPGSSCYCLREQACIETGHIGTPQSQAGSKHSQLDRSWQTSRGKRTRNVYFAARPYLAVSDALPIVFALTRKPTSDAVAPNGTSSLSTFNAYTVNT